jgi:hypothetical protein
LHTILNSVRVRLKMRYTRKIFEWAERIDRIEGFDRAERIDRAEQNEHLSHCYYMLIVMDLDSEIL